MLKTNQFKTLCKGFSHSSKTANIILPGLMIKQRWTSLRLQAKWYYALCWLKQLTSPKFNTLPYFISIGNHMANFRPVFVQSSEFRVWSTLSFSSFSLFRTKRNCRGPININIWKRTLSRRRWQKLSILQWDDLPLSPSAHWLVSVTITHSNAWYKIYTKCYFCLSIWLKNARIVSKRTLISSCFWQTGGVPDTRL